MISCNSAFHIKTRDFIFTFLSLSQNSNVFVFSPGTCDWLLSFWGFQSSPANCSSHLPCICQDTYSWLFNGCLSSFTGSPWNRLPFLPEHTGMLNIYFHKLLKRCPLKKINCIERILWPWSIDLIKSHDRFEARPSVMLKKVIILI